MATVMATVDATVRSSAAWWAATRDDPRRLHAWLAAQYRGEVTAASRIEALRDRHARPGERAHRVLTAIAGQEKGHAAWVADLLRARGLAVEVVGAAEERYWRRTLPGIVDLATGCAVGAHAEAMRLARIAAIAGDPDAPPDIRAVFARILPQERWHERAFRGLATPAALDATREAHALGREALGLEP
jgi:rubrerythrin